MDIDKNIVIDRLNRLFKDQNIKRICIYPYGELGRFVHKIIKEQFEKINIVGLYDNNIQQSNVKKISELESLTKQDVDIIIICSVNYYQELVDSIPNPFRENVYSPFNSDEDKIKIESKKIRKSPYRDLSIISQFQTNNKIKEIELKSNIRRNKNYKVKVCFLISYISRLGSLSIYNNMLSSNFFEPFILLYNAHDHLFKDLDNRNNEWEKQIKAYEYLKEKHYSVVNGYDENRDIIPIYNWDIDIIITEDVYLDSSSVIFSNAYINTNYLVCYLNYGFNVENAFNYHYNNISTNTGWKIFVETKTDYLEFMKSSKYCGINTVLVGSPRLDHYAKKISECIIPKKIDNGKPIVIYAPHWTINISPRKLSYATFHLYFKLFLDLVRDNKDINFVFKPHPELSSRLNQLNIMNYLEYEEYLDKWNSFDNGFVFEQGDYIDLFRKADLLIQDSVSFVCEWLPTHKPCIFLINPDNRNDYLEGFSPLGRNIISSYYCCMDTNEILSRFNSLLFKKDDPLKEKREKVLKESFINIGTASKEIIYYLKKILTD